ncbi:hypothetical protein EI613_00535 [Azospirillum sp. 412522]|nr:DUF6538 domain-containing protein [Azospirillum sp. 412522]MBY6260411.1 hypothetical protein [Azospirillum sp. 412522]
MTSKTKNLTRLPSGIYQVELALPSDVEKLVGKRSWRKSTRTHDPKEAARIRDQIMVEWREEIDRLRNPSVRERLARVIKAPTGYPGTDDEFISDLVAEPGDEDGPPSLADYIREYLVIARGMAAASRVTHEIAGITFKEEAWKKFISSAERLVVIAESEDNALAKQLSAPVAPLALSDGHNSITIRKALETWKHNEAPIKATASAYDITVRRFIEANGEMTMSQIGRSHVRAFRDKVEEQVSSSGTVKNMLSKLSALVNWATKEGYRSGDNPVKGISPTKNVAAPKKKMPFSIEDINRVHNYIAGVYRKEDDRYWLFTAALLSGMRAEELCALRSSDVCQVDGVWCFDVNRDGGKPVKNEASIRLVPVHGRLIELGLLKHHERTASSGRLFPTLKADDDGRYSGYWLNHINHVLHKNLGFGSEKSFHSTRHAFQDRMRDAEIELTVRDRLFGHSEGGGKRVGGKYGAGHSVEVLHRAMQKLDYPGVDWSLITATK